MYIIISSSIIAIGVERVKEIFLSSPSHFDITVPLNRSALGLPLGANPQDLCLDSCGRGMRRVRCSMTGWRREHATRSVEASGIKEMKSHRGIKKGQAHTIHSKFSTSYGVYMSRGSVEGEIDIQWSRHAICRTIHPSFSPTFSPMTGRIFGFTQVDALY